jgi:hypothetical protein
MKLFTMSCATCHSDKLFGQTILGMSKRFPRANLFFIKGRDAGAAYNRGLVQLYTGASDDEMDYVDRSVANIRSVGLKEPLVLGLDTSLAQVALSLDKREADPWASKSIYYEAHPRPDILDHSPGDSKPAVWWNLKYKNRWLSDGSVVSGNPIHTNLLWNEIGRGTDLKELSQWFDSNEDVIQELTTLTFSIEAPRFEEFFPAELIDETSARRGEATFSRYCGRCHGQYVKNWSQPGFETASWSERIKTFLVKYPEQTKVEDVGTDPNRYLSMQSLEKLNALEISQRNSIVVRAQTGYVPPPLVGVWARWPYLHNNSVPSLCALLTPAKDRPKNYYGGMPIDKARDFDLQCNGYPLGSQTPNEWKVSEKLYRTRIVGM